MRALLVLVVGILIVVAGLIGVVAGIGVLLPKGHLAARKVHLAAPQKKVWQTMTDFAAVPTWWDGIQRAESMGQRDGREVWIETFKQGQPVEIINTEVTPPRRLTRTIPPQDLPFSGAWTYELEPSPDGGTLLTVTERGDVPNPFFRALSYFFFDQRATIDSYIRALGAKLEVEVTPADEPAPAQPAN